MAKKEATTLVNMRIPNSILEKFDEDVAKDNLVPSRTAKIVGMMFAENKKQEKKEKAKLVTDGEHTERKE